MCTNPGTLLQSDSRIKLHCIRVTGEDMAPSAGMTPGEICQTVCNANKTYVVYIVRLNFSPVGLISI